MISQRLFLQRHQLFRSFSNIWEKRIDDFTPVHIESQSSVFIKQYDYKSDPVEPQTKIFLPETGVKFSYTDRIEIINNESSDPITAQIPIKSPLTVKCLDDANLSIHGHEADVRVKLNSGQCTLKSVKCQNTSITSSTSDIELNSIVSNCEIVTNGNITASKIQGETLVISNTKGSVNIESLYAPFSEIYGKYGDINIDSVHGSCKIISGTGNVTIGSSKDNLNIKSRGGRVRVTLQEIDSVVSIQSYGEKVSLFLSDEVCGKCMLSLQATGGAKVTDEIQNRINQNDKATALIQVNCDGEIFVGRAKSWGEDLWDKMKDSDN